VSEANGDAGPAHPYLRPKDAATLIVVRRDKGGPRVLMGRRSDRHVFMPGKVVFPGGKVDRGDHFAPAADELHPAVAAKLGLGPGCSPSRARGLALAAIRETFEETGMLIGRSGAAPASPGGPGWAPFLAAGVVPSLSPLRLIARAVTPPGRPRRFDARFFAVSADAIAGQIEIPEDELIAPAWLTFAEARTHPLPRITGVVLDLLEKRLAEDTDLSPDAPVLFNRMLYGRYRDSLL
jgi:8-oxo-dGTP pyrophosphatase MutT (NUDIX family)